MASEDSDQLTSGCLPVHRFDDPRDCDQTVDIEMPAGGDQPHATRELLKVALLPTAKRMSLEERNYRSHELVASIYDELAKVLAMIVLTLVHVDAPHTEEALQLFERGTPRDTLRHNEPMRNLVPSFVAPAIRSTWLPNEPDGEAPLSVNKAGNPAKLNQPFLLVVCTHDIVTVSSTWDGTRSLGYSGFPAYSQMHTAQLPARGATIHLRTVPPVTTRSSMRAGRTFLPTSHGRP